VFCRLLLYFTGVLISPYPDLLPDVFFDGENIKLEASFDIYISTYIYINNINIPPLMIINRIYENQNLLSL